MKETWYKIISGWIKKIFNGLLTSIVSVSSHKKYVSLNIQECIIQPTLINLHPNECSQYFQELDRCGRSCNTYNDLTNNVCAPNQKEDLSLSLFNMIAWINESKTLAKHISCKYKCKFDGRKSNSDHWWNNNKCQC